MEHQDIRMIEEATGIKLPKAYADIITNYPKELLGTDAQDFGLIDDAERIINENLSVRKDGFFGESWPERYFIVGENGCGDYYVINYESDDFTIGFANHETMECRPYADSLSDFIGKYLNEI